MGKVNAISGIGSYDVYKDWCLTIFNYLMSLDSAFNDMVYGEYGLMSIIAKADKTQNVKMMKALYKETNIIIEETYLPDSQMDALNQILQEKFGHTLADESDKETAQIAKIIKRGKIRNDREFELVKRREDMVYADDSQLEYTQTLQKLMSGYEFPEKD